MTLKAVITDSKTNIAGIVIVITASSFAFGWIKLPERVDKVEEKVAVSEDNVQQMAQTIEKYIAVQEERTKSQDNREKLMMELIRQGNGS